MRTHLLLFFCFFFLFPFFFLNEGKTLHLTYQSKRIFNSGSRFCNLGPSVIRTECELVEMLVWIFNKLSLPILIQGRKLHINAARSCQTEKRCFPSRVQASPVLSNKVEHNNNNWQKPLTPSQSCWIVIMGHGQKHWSLLRTGHRTTNTERSIYI